MVAVAILTVANGRPPIAAIVIAVTWSFYGLCKQRTPLTGIESFAAETFFLVIPAVIVVAMPRRRDGQRPGGRPARRSSCSWR